MIDEVLPKSHIAIKLGQIFEFSGILLKYKIYNLPFKNKMITRDSLEIITISQEVAGIKRAKVNKHKNNNNYFLNL